MKTYPVLAAALLLTATLTAQAQTVKVEFLMGKVNLTAQNAPLRTIINEWARVGGMRVVNPERLSGPPVTLQLTDVPERQAIDILLRDVGGFMLGARRTALVPGISAYDRLVVVTSTAGPALRPAPAAAGGNLFPRPPMPNPNPRRQPGLEPDNDPEPVSEPQADEPVPGGVPNRQNVRPAVMPPMPPAEEPVSPPSTTGTTPGNPFGGQGASRPGVITPVAPTNQSPRPPND